MSKPNLKVTSPGMGQGVVSWPVVLGLAILLPILEWGAPRLLRSAGIAMNTASFWAAALVADGLFIVLLIVVAGQKLKQMWSIPGLKDLGITLAAFVAGWMVIPMVQFAVRPLGITTSSGAQGVSLLPSSGSEMALLALAAVVGALAQELTYRGLLWERLEMSTRNVWIALGFSSFMYGLLFINSGVVSFLSVGVGWGLVAGVLFLLTRRLSAVILLNALNVFLTYAILFRYL